METEEKKPKRGRPPKGAEPKFKTVQADVNEELYRLWNEEVSKSGFTGSMFLRSVMVQFLIDRGKIAGWDAVKERFGRTPKLPEK